MDHALGAYRVKRRADFLYSVILGETDSNKRAFHFLYRGAGLAVRTLHLPTAARALLSELESLRFHERDDAVYVAAMPIARNGTAALTPSNLIYVIADHGSRARRAGLTLGSVPHVAVDPNTGRLVPITPELEIAADAFDVLERMLPCDTGSPDKMVISKPTEVGVVCTFAPGLRSALPAPRGEILYWLVRSATNVPRIGRDAVEGLHRLVAGSRCYALPPVVSVPDTIDSLAGALAS